MLSILTLEFQDLVGKSCDSDSASSEGFFFRRNLLPSQTLTDCLFDIKENQKIRD